MCVCQKDNKNDVEAAVGRDFYVMRGKEFRRFVQNIGNAKPKHILSTSGQTEVQEA
jgi:hypothetical protein